MIDTHAHILPGLDDGPATLEESVAMVRIAAESGTTDLVATPHANLDFQFDPEVAGRKLREVAEASGGVLRLHRGCDFHFYSDNIRDALANPTRYTIAGGQYLLVEFPDLLISKTTEEDFTRLLEAGMVPVITHPERNQLIQRRLDRLRGWVNQGCLVQVTAQSFLGRFGSEAQRFSRELMKAGLVHLVASDAHDPEDRPPRLDQAYQHVAKRYGESRAQKLFVENPRAVLTSEVLSFQEDPGSEPARPWYKFWAR